MKKSIYIKFAMLASILFIGLESFAQTPIFTEDFSGGAVPATWTNADLSGGNGLWSWCNDPATALGAGCVANWATYNGQHDDTFNAGSADNGFLVYDSDIIGSVAVPHEGTITTPALDFSATSSVFLKFESLIGVWEFATPDNALVRVSTDNSTWTDFNFINIRRGQDGNNTEFTRWSINPEVTVIDISSVAAGQSNVYIQWYWRGSYEYYWLLDDIEVYDTDVRDQFLEKFDLRVTDFFAGAPNAQTPSNQLTPFSFLADVYNPGYGASNNAVLDVQVYDPSGASIHSDNLVYGNLAPDSLAENQPFTNFFTPPNDVGQYSIVYEIQGDDTDLVPADNTATFEYHVTDTTFAKENGGNTGLEAVPNANTGAPWAAVGDPRSWFLGNYYYVTNGDGYYARTVDFGITNASELVNKVLFIWLWSWSDANEDGIAQPDERISQGFSSYVITGDEAADDILSVRLEGTGASIDEIPLEDNTGYILGAAYTAETGEDFSASFAINDEISYAARVFYDDDQMVDPIYYGPFTGFGTEANSLDFTAGGFYGNDFAPVIRLNIGSAPVSTNVVFSNTEFSVTPSISSDVINVNINLEGDQATQLLITDMNGNTVEMIALNQSNSVNEIIDVKSLASGMYFARLTAGNKSATRKFVVIK